MASAETRTGIRECTSAARRLLTPGLRFLTAGLRTNGSRNAALAEDDHLKRILQRLGLMPHAGRHVQHVPRLDSHCLAADDTSKRPLQHVNHLFALVTVERDVRSAEEVNLDHHLAVADNHFAGHHFRHSLKRNFIPPFNAPCLHVAYVSADETRTGGYQTCLPAVGTCRV